ncbi:PepSY domain-containing protein [Paenibacillus sinopodophylli]|uniref:PepSY domain-containing protein n=1 Tax=Paenibacillus sinopodophylli TaxID=1837342 RepID=UPI001485EFB3|nr:PepSY domain-containing protein [Paenibacillus sinopodophylli]
MMYHPKWRPRIIAAVIIIGVIAALLTFIFISRADRSQGLTLAEAEQEVQGLYEGEIVSSKEQGEGYVIQLQSAHGLYELTVELGGITVIRTLERFDVKGPDTSPEPVSPAPTQNPTPTPAETKQPEITPKPTAPETTDRPTSKPITLISEQKASELALQKIPGKVKDIDKENEGGKWYFFVEIETNDGREADVQLNAASGAVVSVTWDDDSDDDE